MDLARLRRFYDFLYFCHRPPKLPERQGRAGEPSGSFRKTAFLFLRFKTQKWSRQRILTIHPEGGDRDNGHVDHQNGRCATNCAPPRGWGRAGGPHDLANPGPFPLLKSQSTPRPSRHLSTRKGKETCCLKIFKTC